MRCPAQLFSLNWLVVILFAVSTTAPALAQISHRINVDNFSGKTLGAKVLAAQSVCKANKSLPCVLVIGPSLKRIPRGSMPHRCPNCIWEHSRTSQQVAQSGFHATAAIFGLGQPVAAIHITHGACSSAPSVRISPPAYWQDGSQAKAVGLCIHGRTRVAIRFPGSGYKPGQTATITGGGTSGARATLVLAGDARVATPNATNSSLSAIQNAVDYAYTHAATRHNAARVYLSEGIYKLDGALRLPCDVSLKGAGMAATILEPTVNDSNGITVYNAERHSDAWDCKGSLADLAVDAPGGHHYTATEVSLLGVSGFTLRNLDINGGGGRGLATGEGTERTLATNIEIDTVRWPLIWIGNEQHMRKLNIALPGASDDIVKEPGGGHGHYCFGTGNCVHGVFPSNKWRGGKLLYASGNGRTATFYVRGNAPMKSTAPIITGQHFVVAGVAGINLNGLYQATRVINHLHSPHCGSAGECFQIQASASAAGRTQLSLHATTARFHARSTTISVSSPRGFSPWAPVTGPGIAPGTWVVSVSGHSVTLSRATTKANQHARIRVPPVWKPAIMPDHNAAVTFESAAGAIEDGSIKALFYAGCFHADTFGSSISHFYCEGFPIHGQPRVDSVLQYGGDPTVTKLVSSLPGSAGPWTTVKLKSNAWFPTYVNNPQNILLSGLGGSEVLKIVPADYQHGNRKPSTDVPGLRRDQYELVRAIMTRHHRMILAARHLAGSTAPKGTRWPAGSLVAQYPQSSPGYGPLLVADNHANAIDGPSQNWATGCNDQNQNICATWIIGSIPNQISTFTTGQAGGRAGLSGANVTLLDNERWTNAGHFDTANEALGQGFVKTVGQGGTVTALWGTSAAHHGYGDTAKRGQLLADGYINVRGFDGSYPYASYTDLDNGLTFNTENGSETLNPINTRCQQAPLTGSPAGSAIGMQFENSYCYWDTSPHNAGHATTRWCFVGGPSAAPRFEIDKWTGHHWRTVFSDNRHGAVSINGGHGFRRHTLISAAIVPHPVQAHSCSPQTFSVGSIQAGDIILNGDAAKPTFTPGVIIGGIRVPAAGKIAIDYCNLTDNAITPPRQTYTFDVEQ